MPANSIRTSRKTPRSFPSTCKADRVPDATRRGGCLPKCDTRSITTELSRPLERHKRSSFCRNQSMADETETTATETTPAEAGTALPELTLGSGGPADGSEHPAEERTVRGKIDKF